MFPYFPAGATISSIHLVSARTGQHACLRSSIKDTYGQFGRLQNPFGYKARSFIEQILKNTIGETALFDQHTMFPLTRSIATSQAADRWRNNLAAGDINTHLRVMRLHGGGIEGNDTRRQCPLCVQEDIANFGTGHWRVIHQVPVIRLCHSHQVALHDRCASCSTSFSENAEIVLPGEPCPRCGSTKTSSPRPIAPSSGYLALARLIDRALRGEAPELSPNIRTRLLQHIIATSNCDAEALLKQFLDWWDVDSLAKLDTQLIGRTCRYAALRFFTNGHAHVGLQFMMAAIAFAWEHTSESDQYILLQNRSVDPDLFSVSPRSTQPENQIQDELLALSQLHHLPKNIVDLLIQGDKSAALYLVGRVNFMLLLDGLSQKTKDQVKKNIAGFSPRLHRRGET